MAGLYFNDGAAWRRARGLWVHDGAAWRKSRAVYVHDGVAWRRSGASQPVNFSGIVEDYVSGVEGAAAVTCRILEDGRVTLTASHNGTTSLVWYDEPEAAIGAGYWIRAVLVSGMAPNTGAALNTWLSLGSARQWGYSTNASGNIDSRSGAVRFDISTGGSDSTIVCVGTIDFSATREA